MLEACPAEGTDDDECDNGDGDFDDGDFDYGDGAGDGDDVMM